MAYVNLVAQTCPSKAALFCNFRDFVCKRNGTYNDYSSTGIGATLVDSSYGVDEDNPALNDWFVFMLPGENNDFELYIKITWASTSYIQSQTGIYWNATTHAFGSPVYSSAYNIFYAADAETFTLWIYGDLNLINFCTLGSINTLKITTLGGRLEPGISGRSWDILTATSTYSSGSDVSITFNEAIPADWVPGKGIHLWESDGSRVIVTPLKTVDSGTKTITVDLAYALSSSTIRASRHSGFFYSTSGASCASGSLLFGSNGTYNQTMGGYKNLQSLAGAYSGIVPEPLNNEFLMTPFYIWYTAGYAGRCQNTMVVSGGASYGGLNDYDVVIDSDGVNWRCFPWGSYGKYALKEV